jgi:cysteine desulfurase
MLSKGIYLDYNATSPVHPDVIQNVSQWLEAWGNPSSIHAHGREAKKWIREARAAFAQLIDCHPTELIFTSGGSEANNMVIKGLLDSELSEGRNEIISTEIEHPSVLRTLEYAESLGFRVHRVPVARTGEFDLDFFKRHLSDKTLLVSVMTANNETGTLLPIKKIATLAKEVGALVHTDAVQTLGRVPFSVQDVGVDFATFSGHKFYGLKGCGVLFQRRGNKLENFILGGGQERGRRAGTENTLAIASVGLMASLIAKKSQSENTYDQLQQLRDSLETQIVASITGVTFTARETARLPNTTSLVISGVHGESLLMSLDVKGFSVSTGAACSSGSPEPSHVLLAMGLAHAEAQSSLRLSVGWMTTEEEVNAFVGALAQTVKHLRSLTTGGVYA